MTKEEYGVGYGPWSSPMGQFRKPDPEPSPTDESDRSLYRSVVEAIMDQLDQAIIDLPRNALVPSSMSIRLDPERNLHPEPINRRRRVYLWDIEAD